MFFAVDRDVFELLLCAVSAVDSSLVGKNNVKVSYRMSHSLFYLGVMKNMFDMIDTA